MIFEGIIYLSLLFGMIYYLIEMGNYSRGWTNCPELVDLKSPKNRISIIVPVRNEAVFIERCLHSLLRQEYPKELFEIILVDDYSTDNTVNIARQFPDIKVISLREKLGAEYEDQPNKKLAISIGVEKATGDLIACIDGDCAATKWWLASINSHVEKTGDVFMTGPLLLFEKSGLLNIFQQLDILTMTGITAAAIQRGQPEMSNGGNMCFTKAVFNELNGFSGIDQLPTGDDVLLMHKIDQAYPGKVGYIKSLQSIVYSLPLDSWKALFHQRIRWVSKTNAFPKKEVRYKLFLMGGFHIALIISFIAAGFDLVSWYAPILFFMAKAFTDFMIVYSFATYFNKRKLLAFFLPVEILHILYIFIIGIAGAIGSYTWKGRQVKTVRNN